MLGHLVALGDEPKMLDATDAVAVAVCHYYQGKAETQGKNYSGWKSFLEQNPGRIAKK